MAHFQTDVNITSGQVKSNKFNMSGITVTTNDFFRPIPIRTLPVFPNDYVRIKTESFLRLFPLAVPTFGRVDVVNRWFFVPYRSVFFGWKNFITKTPYKSRIIETVPKIPQNFLTVPFYTVGFPTGTTSVGDIGTYSSVVRIDSTSDLTGSDFEIYDNSSQKYIGYKLSERGRHLYNILCSLGYSPSFAGHSDQVSLLPLLCYLRVILDYYSDPQEYHIFEQYFSDAETITQQQWATYMIVIYNQITKCCYDFDYFTSAWEQPSGPKLQSNESNETIGDITAPTYANNYPAGPFVSNNGAGFGSGNFDTPYLTYLNMPSEQAGPIQYITNYALDSLRALTNYSRRHNLVGWRVMDRFLADFGKKLDYKVANQSVFLCSTSVPVTISDVMSNSDTSQSGGKVLGAYAGKGLGYGDFDFEFNSDDQHGMLICISTINPKISYYQGRVRQQGVLALKPLDFLNGDFDQLGVQAIHLQELMSDFKSPADLAAWQGNYSATKPFGYSQRYAEFKSSYDLLAGDFRCPSVNAGLDSFHLFRQVYKHFTQPPTDMLSISPAFRTGETQQYDRIFANQSDNADHFMMFNNFDIELHRNAASISDTLLDIIDHNQRDQVTVKRDGSLFN